uniref:Uncharacterized protein n=1 Tax=Solanum lycopersicum TaxID=4081 RepID=A0A3Q7G574_SOLLC
MSNFFVDVRQDLVYASGWPSRPFQPILKVKRAPKRAYPSFRRFSCAIANNFLSDPNFNVKRAPKRAYPSFRRFSCAIANHFLGDPDSDVKNAKFSCGRPSRPRLCIHLALTALLTHFEANHILGDPDSDVKNVKCFCGRPSRPCLCIWLALMALPTHFQGQTSPEASIPLISMIFVCYSKLFFGRPSRPCLCIRLAITARTTHLEVNHFLGDPDFDVKNAKFFCGRPSRRCLCIRLAITVLLVRGLHSLINGCSRFSLKVLTWYQSTRLIALFSFFWLPVFD